LKFLKALIAYAKTLGRLFALVNGGHGAGITRLLACVSGTMSAATCGTMSGTSDASPLFAVRVSGTMHAAACVALVACYSWAVAVGDAPPLFAGACVSGTMHAAACVALVACYFAVVFLTVPCYTVFCAYKGKYILFWRKL
jgi:hypothetical protein